MPCRSGVSGLTKHGISWSSRIALFIFLFYLIIFLQRLGSMPRCVLKVAFPLPRNFLCTKFFMFLCSTRRLPFWPASRTTSPPSPPTCTAFCWLLHSFSSCFALVSCHLFHVLLDLSVDDSTWFKCAGKWGWPLTSLFQGNSCCLSGALMWSVPPREDHLQWINSNFSKKTHAALILSLCSFIFLARLYGLTRTLIWVFWLTFLKVECMMIFVTSDKDPLSFNFWSELVPLWYSRTFSETSRP